MKLLRIVSLFFIIVLNLSCLSACNSPSNDCAELVKYFGQSKVAEMKVKCTDKKQLEIADSLIKRATQIMSYTGPEGNATVNPSDALSDYYYFNAGQYENASSANVEIKLITTKQENEKGYVWVKYSCIYYDKYNRPITGSNDIISRWDIALENGTWIVKSIDEMP